MYLRSGQPTIECRCLERRCSAGSARGQRTISQCLTEQSGRAFLFRPSSSPLHDARFCPCTTFMTSRGISWPLRLICLFATSAFASQSFEGRSEQTQAYCGPTFNWATNSQGLSPCLLTAFVWGSCFTGSKQILHSDYPVVIHFSDWNVPQLPPGGQSGYTSPNATTANLCTW